MFSQRPKSSNSQADTFKYSFNSLVSRRRPSETPENVIGSLGLVLLHAPPEPAVDFIFVHGLRGGSTKTWSKSNDPYHFWPKAWLPNDTDFTNVRIHSFGYNSDWADTKHSELGICDFGKLLLAEIRNSPVMGKHSNATPILFIGHSMGGLVMKQMHILASRDPSARWLAERVYGMVFLATPHYGSDSATLLNNFLHATVLYSKKTFVSDLERDSHALRSINDQFRHCAGALELRSFYETTKTNIGISSMLIVEKDSAVTGYPNEQDSLINATHRSICKFDSPSDPNFISVRNALATITKDITAKALGRERDRYQDQLQVLQECLNVFEVPEDDLRNLQDAQLEGSCQWLTRKQEFLAWRDSHPESLPYYWLSAQPGTGKSVMAAHVIQNLESINANCSYHFFKHNDARLASLSQCLRSLAYQMALGDASIRGELLIMKDHGVRFDQENETVVWRKIFLGGVFQVSLNQPHFWVIDALDESASQNSILSMLKQIPGNFPLRVFMTSRPTNDVAKRFSSLSALTYADEITANDTRDDIELYLRLNLTNLPLHDTAASRKITDAVLQKSCGSFLWVALVVEEMQSAFSEADMQRVLEEVPGGMGPLYERALASISNTKRSKHVIRAILQWTVCAIRPLTVEELADALQLDIGEKGLALDNFIKTNCGQLVHVDRSGRVSLLHETVRAFLLRTELESEFAVDKRDGHGRLVDVCLRLLNGDAMKPPRSRKLIHVYSVKALKRSPFVDYAAPHFSQHLRRSRSEDPERLASLCSFLKGNVCSWIEYIARTKDLHYLVQTATDMRRFLQARAKYYSPIDRDVQCVDAWGSDLVHLAAQFGKHLIASPSAIFWLVPPFCPSMSAIGTQFRSISNGINIRGLSSTVWSDRVCCINYREIQARAVACADTTFAVGLSDKSIKIYSYSTFQELSSLDCSQPPKLLQYSTSGGLVAVSSVHFVSVFCVDKAEQLWQARLPQECLSLMFAEQDRTLWVVTKGGTLMSVSAAEGSKITLVELKDPSDEDDALGLRRTFTSATVSLELNMVAVAQRGRPIGLYDMDEGTFIGYCGTDSNEASQRTKSPMLWIQDFLFNPNPASSSLAALYHDGSLALFSVEDMTAKTRVSAEAQVFTCSPDGRFLATGNAAGVIEIFEFESLRLICKIITSDSFIKSMAFSVDGLRFLDIRGSQCNIWETAVLAHADPGETDSVSDVIDSEMTVLGVNTTEDAGEITAVACHSSGEVVVCGKRNGSVALYSAATGKEIQLVHQQAEGLEISFLECGSSSDMVVSADSPSGFKVWQLVRADDEWTVQGPVLDGQISGPSIRQFLFSADSKRLLVSTASSDTVYELADGSQSTIACSQDRTTWKWTNHPGDSSKLIYISPTCARIHSWNERLECCSSTDMEPSVENGTGLEVESIIACPDGGRSLSVEFSKAYSQASPSRVMFLPLSSIENDPDRAVPASTKKLSMVSAEMEHLIGTFGRKLLFLDQRMWICSLELDSFDGGGGGGGEGGGSGEYSRHCFIPDDWFNANSLPLLKVTSKGDLVFARKHELAVITRVLDHWETVKVGVS